jgi:hypothetical protein
VEPVGVDLQQTTLLWGGRATNGQTYIGTSNLDGSGKRVLVGAGRDVRAMGFVNVF